MTPVPVQRWLRELQVEPGHWKKQLPEKVRAIARKGDVEGLTHLLKQLPDALNHPGSFGRTLLWEAVRGGKLQAVQLLAERGAEINAVACYNDETMVRISPYCVARHYGFCKIADYLESRGAVDDIYRLAFRGDLSAVERQLDLQPELLLKEDPHDSIYFAPLVAFAVAGGHPLLTRALIRRGADVSSYSRLLLRLAASASRLDLVAILIENGADARAVDPGIFVACRSVEILAYLTSKGTSATLPGANGVTPLQYATRADKGKRPQVVELLKKHGA